MMGMPDLCCEFFFFWVGFLFVVFLRLKNVPKGGCEWMSVRSWFGLQSEYLPLRLGMQVHESSVISVTVRYVGVL